MDIRLFFSAVSLTEIISERYITASSLFMLVLKVEVSVFNLSHQTP